ncbi:hypothetical protein HBI68_242280 [Parastagonospora nodorum]|nr:hypothetical protein HBI68_242280 [Parastagonospora nodorum]
MSCSKRDPIKDHEKFHRDHTLDPKYAKHRTAEPALSQRLACPPSIVHTPPVFLSRSILMRQVEEHNMTITSRPVKSNARRASAPSNFGQAAESFPWLLPF